VRLKNITGRKHKTRKAKKHISGHYSRYVSPQFTVLFHVRICYTCRRQSDYFGESHKLMGFLPLRPCCQLRLSMKVWNAENGGHKQFCEILNDRGTGIHQTHTHTHISSLISTLHVVVVTLCTDVKSICVFLFFVFTT